MRGFEVKLRAPRKRLATGTAELQSGISYQDITGVHTEGTESAEGRFALGPPCEPFLSAVGTPNFSSA